jgi:hypothetical protein
VRLSVVKQSRGVPLGGAQAAGSVAAGDQAWRNLRTARSIEGDYALRAPMAVFGDGLNVNMCFEDLLPGALEPVSSVLREAMHTRRIGIFGPDKWYIALATP